MNKLVIFATLALTPVLASAQQLNNLNNLLTAIGRLINTALPIVVGLAMLSFFWGLMKFIFSAGSEVDASHGKSMMIWSIVALFVMVSVWGLVGFIGDALNIQEGTATPTIPTVPLR